MEALFQAHNLGIPEIQFAVRQHLLSDRSLPKAKPLLREGNEIALLGKTYFNFKALKDRLKKQNITLTKQVSDTTTHLVLGNQPLKYNSAINTSLIYLIPLDLTRFLDQTEDRYLALERQPRQLKSLQKLLSNPKKENVDLAIQLMKGGGVPPSLLTEVFLAWKKSKDPKQKKTLRALLENNIDEKRRPVLSMRINWKKIIDEWRGNNEWMNG